MTNRKKYDLNRDTYDKMRGLNISIQSGDYACIIECITGEYQIGINRERCIMVEHDCDECIQRWVNREAEP